MAWIELHQARQRHPKTLHLARLIKKDRRYTCGLLDDLWTWALDIAERDGLLPGLTGEDIAVALDFPASKGKWLVGALVESGYIDVCSGSVYRLHDWQEYAGKLVERREEQRKYASRQRSLYSDMRVTKAVRQRDGSTCRYCGKIVNWDDRRGIDGGTYDHVDPDGDNSVENIVVACRSCNSKKQDRTPEEACMPLLPAPAEIQQKTGRKQVENRQKKSAITVPNRTLPNRTLPNQTISERGNGAASPRPSPARFTPPSLDEVRTYCQERGNTVDPEKWHDFYASKGWMVGKNKMRDWKAAVRTWEKEDAQAYEQKRLGRKEATNAGHAGCAGDEPYRALPGELVL